MPKTPAAEVDAGGRAVRCLEPGPGDLRGHRADARGDQADGRGVLRERRRRPDARPARPADRPRALDVGCAAGDEARHRAPGRDADAFYQKRVPKGAPDYLESVEVTFPSGRTADEICPTEIAVPVWCAHMGTLTFHPWPVRRVRRRPSRRAAHRPRPAARYVVPRRRPRRRRGPGAARRARHAGATRRPPATAASTCTSGSSRAGSSSTSGTPRSASAGRWRSATTGSPPSGGRRSAASGCSSTSTRTAATARSPRPTRCARSRAPRCPRR